MASEERERSMSKLQELYSSADNLQTSYHQAIHAPSVRDKLLAIEKISLQSSCAKWQCQISRRALGRVPADLIGAAQVRKTHNSQKTDADTILTYPLVKLHQVVMDASEIITGLATSGQYLYVSQFNTSQVMVFTCYGKRVSIISIPKLRNPQGLAVGSKEAALIVVSDNNKALHLIKFSEASLTLTSKQYVTLDYKPWGVSISSTVTPDSTYIIVAAKMERQIVLHSITGAVMRKVDLSAIISEDGLAYAERSKMGYLVTDSQSPQIVLVSEEGSVLKTYTRKSSPKPLRCSWQAVHDCKGNVLVPDGITNRLH